MFFLTSQPSNVFPLPRTPPTPSPSFAWPIPPQPSTLRENATPFLGSLVTTHGSLCFTVHGLPHIPSSLGWHSVMGKRHCTHGIKLLGCHGSEYQLWNPGTQSWHHHLPACDSGQINQVLCALSGGYHNNANLIGSLRGLNDLMGAEVLRAVPGTLNTGSSSLKLDALQACAVKYSCHQPWMAI